MLKEAEAADDHTFMITAPSAEPSLGFCTAAEAHTVLYTVLCHEKDLKAQMSSAFLNTSTVRTGGKE